MTSIKKRIACIGGGAAGYFAAINAARLSPDAEVFIIEKTRQPLAKVKISGGGRCNVTHNCFEPALLAKSYPRGSDFLKRAFYAFQPKDMIKWMEERGVELKVEPDGRMFPKANTSSAVIGCFVKEAESLGVKLLLESEVVSIEQRADHLLIHIKDKEPLSCDAALLATGGMSRSYHLAEALGHHVESSVPSLFTFNIKDSRLEEISGVSVPHAKAQIVSSDIQSEGPLLVTHWGLSGPAILRLSAWGARFLAEKNYHAEVKINWVGGERELFVKDRLIASRQAMGSQKVVLSPLFSLPKSLWRKLVIHAGISEGRVFGQMTKIEVQSLYECLTCSVFTIEGKSTNKDEFVTCGGIPLNEIDLKTMQSKICKGLYFAGEVINVDGITGGFNFQNAWTTAWIAAHAMVKSFSS